MKERKLFKRSQRHYKIYAKSEILLGYRSASASNVAILQMMFYGMSQSSYKVIHAWLVCLSGLSVGPWTEEIHVQFTVKGTYLGCWFNPWLRSGWAGGNQSLSVSPFPIPYSLPHSLPRNHLSISCTSLGEDFKQKGRWVQAQRSWCLPVKLAWRWLGSGPH